jgi:thiamine pyrophosphokinase
VILGDFDSVDPKIQRLYEEKPTVKVLQYEPEKDDTDTQMAVKHAMEVGCTQITLIGATGSRIDHLLGNIFCLYEPLEAGIECYLLDKNNKIMLLNKSYQLKKQDQYGYYVSLLPFTEVVSGVTLRGFKYPLTDYTLTKRSGGLGVSNEIIEKTAEIDFQSGILIMIQSKD